MTQIEVTTTVVLTDSIGRHVGTVTNTARADAPNERYAATYTRGAIQSTEYQIAAALIAQFGDKPEGGPTLRQSLGMDEGRRERIAGRLSRRDQIEANRMEAQRAERAMLPEPFAQGHVVELSSGDYAGRIGQIAETQHHAGDISTATVQLMPPGDPLNPSEPIVVTGVRFDDMELVN